MTVRVLHVLRSAQHDWTGIARVVTQALPQMALRHYESDAVFLGPEGPLAPMLARAGATVRFLPWNTGARDPLGALRFARFVRAGRYDIVHAHVGGRLLLRLCAFTARSGVVFHVHSRVREVGERYVEGPIHTAGADAVIAVSRSVAGAISDARATVIYSGVPVPPLPAAGVRAALPTVIGAAGRLTAGKAFTDLVRALPLIPDTVQLEIAGDGPQRESIAALARELGVSNRVTLLGWVPDMRPLLARWTLFANPSLEEGFGLAVVEAMAAALPVVATPVGGVPEVAIDGENALLVRPGHPEELAAAINRVLADRTLAERLVTRARQHVERHFSIQQQVDATDRLYQSLLRDRGRRGRNATALA